MDAALPDAEQPTSAASRRGLVVIGNFDGVHRGHRAVLSGAADEARRSGLVPIVMTFHPHPAKALGRTPPPLLTRLPRKVELIRRDVPDVRVVVETFDAAFAAQAPEEFARRVLVGKHGARAVVVGQNFRFGRARSGDLDELARLGRSLGFDTRSHPLVGDAEGPWSSTRIRAAIARGALDEAERLLGRPHMVSGVVVAGDRRGRTIGFPTCNVADVEEVLPPLGVYAVLVDRVEAQTEGGAGPERAAVLARGVANLGVRPTVRAAAGPPTLEVHLFDVHDDLYGARLRVHLVASLRPEQTFASLADLEAQIARDAAAARGLLSERSPDPAARGAWH